MEINIPLVSIVCTTYNHQNYIKDALEGFLMQRTTFPFEIIVHDDASTDDTVQIIKEYEQRYPDLFFNIYQEENQYSQGIDIWKNLFLNYCRGQYIAICEGDDYWTDPLKLQKQVNFLEEHSKVGMVYGRVVYYQHDTRKSISVFGKGVNNIQELLIGNVIPTLSVCMRKELCREYYSEIQPFLYDWKMGDYPMWLWFSYRSSIKFIEDIVGVYRILSESVSHSINYQKELAFIKSYADIKFFFINKFKIEDKHIINNIKEQYLIGVYRIVIKHCTDRKLIKSELEKYNIKTRKISIIRLAVKFRVVRSFLQLYWNIKSKL